MRSADPTVSPGGVGAALAAARAEQGLSVADVSDRTNVRATLIRQMENDDFSGCGGSVYARGHIRGISRTLGIDPVPLIAEFDRAHSRMTQPQVLPSREFDPLTGRNGRGRGRGFPWVPAMGVSLAAVCVLALLAFLLPGGSGSSARNPTVGATVVTPTASTMPASPAPTRSTVARLDGVNVQVAVRDNPSWLEARDETRRVLLQQILQPGDSRTLTAARSMEIRIGNAGAVDVSCNGRGLGPSGSPGQVVTVRVGIGASGDCAVGDSAPR